MAGKIVHTGHVDEQHIGLSIIRTQDIDFDSLARTLETDDELGIFVAETFANKMDKYVPMRTGMLASSYDTEPYLIRYRQDYAWTIYNGTQFNFNTQYHPNATAYWDLVAWQAHSNEITKAVQDYINTRL